MSEIIKSGYSCQNPIFWIKYILIILSLCFSCTSKNSQTELYELLVEELVEPEFVRTQAGPEDHSAEAAEDPFTKGTEVLEREPVKRWQIYQAQRELIAADKSTWPVLFKYMNDKRPSDCTVSDPATATVGHQVNAILYKHAVSLPNKYHRKKFFYKIAKNGSNHRPPGFDIKFNPSLKAWLLARKHLSQSERQLQVLKDVIKRENELGYPNEKETVETQSMLNNHMQFLQEKIRKDKNSRELTFKQIIIPKVRFVDRNYLFVMDFLERKTKQLSKREIKWLFLEDTELISDFNFNIHMDNVSLIDLMNEVCKKAGVTYQFGKTCVIIRKK